MKYASNQKIVEKKVINGKSTDKWLIYNFIAYLEVQVAPPGDKIRQLYDIAL